VVCWARLFGEDRARYTVGMQADGTASVELTYVVNGTEARCTLRVEPTRNSVKARRWRWRCPVMRGEERCGRRGAVLYLPPGERLFGCRQCYNA